MIVVNKRTHKPAPDDVYIGRPSIFGNPFVIGKDGDREAVIRAFLEELAFGDDPRFECMREAIKGLSPDANLVCFCAPEACHGDVIIRYWRETHK